MDKNHENLTPTKRLDIAISKFARRNDIQEENFRVLNTLPYVSTYSCEITSLKLSLASFQAT